MKVILSQVQKKVICIELAKHLPKIRELLHMNQKEFSSICGISTDRLSRIENHHTVMTWCQANAIVLICHLNMVTKEYIYMNNIVPEEFFQYIQQLDESIPPMLNVIVRDEVIDIYKAQKGEKKDGII